MKKLLHMFLLLAMLQLADTVYSKPFRVTDAKVLPSGSVLAWGASPVDNTVLPTVAVVDTSGKIYNTFYLTIPNSRIVVLDAINVEGGIVIGGFIERERLREAFAAKINDRTVEWAFSLQQGPYFVKTLTRYVDGYILTGPISGVSDSDIAVVYINDQASIKNAVRIGSPMYDDFVETVYASEESPLLIGSTWCQNVSYADALLIDVSSKSFGLITIGGADRDEGLAAKVLDSRIVLAGSSFSSPGGLSDAFLAILNDAALRVLTVGWPSYDGFVDACGNLKDLFLLGYATIDGKSRGLLVRVSEKKTVSGLLIECEENIIPLAIGYDKIKIITVFKISDAMIVITFDYNLRPLTAFTVGESSITTIRVLNIMDLEKRVYNLDGKWRIQELNLSPTSIEVSMKSLDVEVYPNNLSLKPLHIEVGEYTERVPLTQLLVNTIERNVPMIIIFLPLFAVILAIIAAKRAR